MVYVRVGGRVRAFYVLSMHINMHAYYIHTYRLDMAKVPFILDIREEPEYRKVMCLCVCVSSKNTIKQTQEDESEHQEMCTKHRKRPE